MDPVHKMSLRRLLENAYHSHKNWKSENFIPYSAARNLITPAQVEEWSKDHVLCQEHGQQCPRKSEIIQQIVTTNYLTYIVLVFAELEYMAKSLILVKKSTDIILFHTTYFAKVWNKTVLNDEQREKIFECRKYVGAIFSSKRYQDMPSDAILPFLRHESLDKAGSFGVIDKVEIAGLHIMDYDQNIWVAKKRVRPSTDASQDELKQLFREVETLLKRRDHPNVIKLLGSFSMDIDESGNNVKILHLLLPLADIDLADWMTQRHTPPDVVEFTEENREVYLYRLIYKLVSGMAYLHREIDGMITAHHDLKPHNILMLKGELKIADLGDSHLRPIIQGSATERHRMGTYEYQPPEYWNSDGTPAEGKHGRPFDVWAVGCIVVELVTLIVHGWQPNMVTEFKTRRRQNPQKDRTTPSSVGRELDHSFHNNLSVVKQWIDRLKQGCTSQKLHEALAMADKMMDLNVRDRPYMWEVEMDLNQLLRSEDEEIPHLEGDFCTKPAEIREGPILLPSGFNDRLNLREGTETPLHRAASKNDVGRVIRLWELQWPLNLTDGRGRTPLDIMSRNPDQTIRDLEKNVRSMLKAAETGEVRKLEELFNAGVSALMTNKERVSALFLAIEHCHWEVIERLTKKSLDEQLQLLHPNGELPLHTAARVGLTTFLEKCLDRYPDVDVRKDKSPDTALCLAARGNHVETMKLLIQKGARVRPPTMPENRLNSTPLHITRTAFATRVILEADRTIARRTIEQRDGWGFTPLLDATYNCCFAKMEILIEHGASIDALNFSNETMLHIAARRWSLDELDHLKRHMHKFSVATLEARTNMGKLCWEIEHDSEEKKVPLAMKALVKQAKRLAGGGGHPSGILSYFSDFIR